VAGCIVKGVVCFLSAGLLVVWSIIRILNCRVPADSSSLDNQRVGITYRCMYGSEKLLCSDSWTVPNQKH
jgi:hypothetical protein